jgi:hypothetical protein
VGVRFTAEDRTAMEYNAAVDVVAARWLQNGSRCRNMLLGLGLTSSCCPVTVLVSILVSAFELFEACADICEFECYCILILWNEETYENYMNECLDSAWEKRDSWS